MVMAAALISCHSSNPLEVGSSDTRNNDYHAQYAEGRRKRACRTVALSSDPINGYDHYDVHNYRIHIAELFPGIAQTVMKGGERKSLKRKSPVPPGMIDLDEDEDMASEDELNLKAERVVTHNSEGASSQTLEEHQVEADMHTECNDESDEENDADDSDDEENTIFLKPPEERAQIAEEIADMYATVPQLEEDYKLIDRLGTGTFSAVYKAVDLNHSKWDNSCWQPHTSLAVGEEVAETKPAGKVFVAVKRIYVTSSPERIRNEIALMEACRGCRHVSQLITAFREQDQVVAIMPFNRNDDFRDFYRELTMPAIKAYLRCLFRALRDVHGRGIIHRDVKPANFLFDPRTGNGILCDFGLACRTESSHYQSCLHTAASAEYPHGRAFEPHEIEVVHVRAMQREARQKSTYTSDKVGYPSKDTRPQAKANRAGTRGFRAPEVLLKCADQSGAIDVWSAGMILLFFLTGKFPLFQSNDDIEALMEITVIIGRKKMEKAATLHNRTFATNVPTVTLEGRTWRSFVEQQNEDLMKLSKPNEKYWPHNLCLSRASSRSRSSSSSSRSSLGQPDDSATPSDAAAHAADVEAAFDLLDMLLHPEATKRITPRDALYHPFLSSPSSTPGEERPCDDDDFFPHPFGEGVCGSAHFRDETDEPCVRVKVKRGDEVHYEIRRLVAGEGIAIGRKPCEFHVDEFGEEDMEEESSL